MTVKLEGTIQRYIGLSTDVKPDPVRDTTVVLAAGSSFLESDTGLVYRWDGLHWQHAEVPNIEEPWLAAIYEELVRIRTGIELVTGVEVG